MNKPVIKICGVCDPKMAGEAARLGADFVGIIFHPQSRRFVKIEQTKAIAAAAKENGAIPVAVFVDHTADQMAEICIQSDIQTIQLHGSMARKQHSLLPADYQRIYVQAVSSAGVINNDADNGLLYCDPRRDYLLFDNVEAGKGRPFNWDAFKYSGHFRMGLAGGLTPDNVGLAIKKFQPALVDVSSGVENSSGEKDLRLIKDFIKAVGVVNDHK
ncbi:MAG: phosphoribosylanthranilate isomerase [Legionellales bacterium]|nr:phosphoribosylanthranilate isomerase [Legionellales bacterium]